MNENQTQELHAQLLEAVLHGDAASVRTLLAVGANPNHRDGRSYALPEQEGGDYPMLLLAVLRDDIPTASALLEAGADANAVSIDYLERPRNWMMAMSFNCLGWKYRPYGIKYTGPELYHARALDFASSAAMAELLLAHGADGACAHHNHFLSEGKASPELTQILLRASLEASSQSEDAADFPIHLAAEEGYADLLKLTMERGTPANMRDKQKCRQLLTALGLAPDTPFEPLPSMLPRYHAKSPGKRS